jgi:fructose-bisphosphate aldolase class II
MLIEGELGYIGKSSSVRAELPKGVKISEEYLTKPEEAALFVKETGVDLLAPAVGNVHGMLQNGHDPDLSIERIRAIHERVRIPLVLHGASGNTEKDLKNACLAGAAIVHVSTELRVSYRSALQLSLQSDPDEVAPYKYLRSAAAAVEKVVVEKLKIIATA